MDTEERCVEHAIKNVLANRVYIDHVLLKNQ